MELTKVMAGIPDYSKEDSQMVVSLLNKHLGFEWEHSGVDFLQIALEKGFGSRKGQRDPSGSFCFTFSGRKRDPF
jgi:hypothetical protein